MRARYPAAVLAALSFFACQGEPAVETMRFPVPEGRPDLVDLFRSSLAAQLHPSDGGGRAWIDTQEPATLHAGELGRFDLVFETGPAGVARGGMVFLQISPYWGWSTPQTTNPELAGFTVVTTDAEGVELTVSTVAQQLLGITIEGRDLAPKEQLRIVYGASDARARVDRFAERETHLWIAVDGDGDGRRKVLADSPRVDIAAGPPAQIIALVPSTARPGDRVQLSVAILDRFGNAGVDFEGEVMVEPSAIEGGLETPPSIRFSETDGGSRMEELVVAEEGVYRLVLWGPNGLVAETNPLVVTAESPRILWGDLHGHSHFSDGTGTPKDYFAYARDVAALDVAALTDHDHFGMLPLATHSEMWDVIREQVKAHHEPGRFVTLLGYEWTNWIWGHRHVLYFSDQGEVLSSVDRRYESPTQLWEALRGSPALTFAHHSAGGPIATNWNVVPDPELEPITEIVSVHGSSEAPDSPHPIYAPVAGNSVRDVLEGGIRLGLIGSGDSHDGHPGLAHLYSPSGGLAAILSDSLTRDGVLEALRARRVYATNGPRIVLRLAIDGRRMGSVQQALGAHSMIGIVVSPSPLDRVDIVRRGGGLESLAGEGKRFFSFRHDLDDVAAGDFVYVRAVQTDGGAAWSSPFFFE